MTAHAKRLLSSNWLIAHSGRSRRRSRLISLRANDSSPLIVSSVSVKFPARPFRALKLNASGRWSLLALFVGLVVGLASIAFEWMTQAVRRYTLVQFAGYPQEGSVGEHYFFEVPGTVFSPWMVVSVMTLGGLISGMLVYWFAPEASGAGTDAAVDAFHNRKGQINWRVPWVKTIASAVTLGTGGSGGREGPIAQIGAGIGAWTADRLSLSATDRRILLAAGVGAGVGAMFRAPLAGAIFAAEILYSDSDMEADVIVPSAIASIVAYSVYTQSIPAEVRFQPIFGNDLAHTLHSPAELLPYTLLAIVLLFLAAFYVRFFHATQKLFESLPVRPHLRPAIGAMLAGLFGIGLFVYSGHNSEVLGVLGTGYRSLQNALTGGSGITIGVLAIIAFGKMLTTSLSIGSGGSGGVFGPLMVIGGCAGAAFGQAGHSLFPEWVPYPAAFAVVGMAGFFSGVARAPISTIILIRELTGDFGLLVPTMLVCAMTFVFSSKWILYTHQVGSRLESPAHRGDFLVDVLEGLAVKDVFHSGQRLVMIHEGASLDQIVHRLAETNQHYFPVIDSQDAMVGLFSADDVRAYLYDETLWRLANARDVMISNFYRVSPDDDLNVAMQQFTTLNVDELPVIDPENPTKLLGFLGRKETIAAYNRRILEHRRETEQHG